MDRFKDGFKKDDLELMKQRADQIWDQHISVTSPAEISLGCVGRGKEAKGGGGELFVKNIFLLIFVSAKNLKRRGKTKYLSVTHSTNMTAYLQFSFFAF